MSDISGAATPKQRGGLVVSDAATAKEIRITKKQKSRIRSQNHISELDSSKLCEFCSYRVFLT